MPFLAEKIKVHYDYRFEYPENGLSFVIEFIGLDYEVPLCTVGPSNGSYPLTGNNLV